MSSSGGTPTPVQSFARALSVTSVPDVVARIPVAVTIGPLFWRGTLADFVAKLAAEQHVSNTSMDCLRLDYLTWCLTHVYSYGTFKTRYIMYTLTLNASLTRIVRVVVDGY